MRVRLSPPFQLDYLSSCESGIILAGILARHLVEDI